MIIAMDGPAASGKGTLGRKLAEKFDLAYLDTGALYRAVGLGLKRAGHGPEDADRAAHAAKTLDPDLLNDPELRSEQVGHMARSLPPTLWCGPICWPFSAISPATPLRARPVRCWMGAISALWCA
ncbi:hypothetical protein JCM17844_13740 [Iodidimonas gelatinilytica]|uniref:(d)CMP kinase n=1 Tax=Iodidimonas gelatinilytica TaxID=1236966 RepID=A0A5A7MP49_9PROT|nr:(d)CMP kinase [Iodidimonas gelatinilytica]GEQ97737.1 hypothetical protein JCM17844_13740 [Iodidimonas gelatinilytica]